MDFDGRRPPRLVDAGGSLREKLSAAIPYAKH